MDLTESLEQSCDVYYYEVAQRVGIEKISAMARRLGIGERYDLPMSAISEGLAPDKDWKRTKYGNGLAGRRYVQLRHRPGLRARLAAAARGDERPDRLGPRGPAAARSSGQRGRGRGAGGARLGIDPGILRAVRGGMFEVSNSRRGTAYGSRIVDDTMRMAGKTGTSQVRNITAAERARGVISNDDLPWERRDHALFVSFAPFDAPRVAVSVVVEHGGGGSTVAAPDRPRYRAPGAVGRLPAAHRLSRKPARPDQGGAREAPASRTRRHRYDEVARMSYLEYNVKTVPTGLRKVLYVNWPLVLLLAATASVGFLMLYSVAGGRLDLWAEPQMKRFAVGMAGMLAVGFVPIWFWRNVSAVAYLVALMLLVAVEFFGAEGKGAQRWLELGPMRIQPSELMKVALVMFLAAYYDWLDIKKTSRPLWVLIPVAIILVPTALVLKQPDLGTAILLVAGGGIVMFVAGVSFWYFGTVIALAVGLVFAVVESRGTDWQLIEDYQFRRIDTFLDPGSDPLGAGYNITQAQIALGSGGWAGKGLHARHAVAAELPARKAHRLHLHHAGRGIRLCRRLLAAGALRAHRLLLHHVGAGEPGPIFARSSPSASRERSSSFSRSTWGW